jgi:hypothetical protein
MVLPSSENVELCEIIIIIIPIIIHLLGLAPAGYLATPDNGASAGYAGVLVKTLRATVVALCH